MQAKRQIEVFTAGCPACADVIQHVRDMACPSCEIEIVNVSDVRTHARVAELEIETLPAVAVDGRLAACCRGSRVSREALAGEGVGVPLE